MTCSTAAKGVAVGGGSSRARMREFEAFERSREDNRVDGVETESKSVSRSIVQTQTAARNAVLHPHCKGGNLHRDTQL